MTVAKFRFGWKSPLAILAVALLTACGGGGGGETDPGQAPPTDSVTGTVKFNGNPLVGAKVLLYSTNTNVFAQTATTDGNGNYSFAGLGTSGDCVADWIIWVMDQGFGFYPAVGPGASVERGGCNNFLLGYNSGSAIGLDVTAIRYDSLLNQSLTGADFNAYDGSNPLVALAGTGQTTKYVTGDDGDLHKGVAWPATRFNDNKDGTVTDYLTGLIWLQDAGSLHPDTWLNALAAVNQLASGSNGLSDGSQAGDWRLPNVDELESLVDVSAYNPALTAGNPFNNVSTTGSYWTSTPYGASEYGAADAWIIRFSDGRFTNDGTTNKMATASNGVWAVKGQGGGTVKLQATGMDMSFASGDDGTVQSGVHFTYPRWVDNGNGTTTDTLTGLVWLRDAGAIHQLNWADAVAAVNALASPQCGLSDGSVAGDWRMPTRNEMQSLSDRNQTNHADYFNNTFRYADESLYQSAVFTGFVSLQYYWTSTTYAADTTQAWTVYSCDFGVYDMPKVIPDGSPMLGYTLAVR